MSTATRAATHRVSAYTVHPGGFDDVDHPEKHDWAVTVADTGRGWRVSRGSRVLSVAGTWTLGEPRPSERDEDHFAQYRFGDAEAALDAAKEAVEQIVIAGMTFARFAEWVRVTGAAKM